GGGQPMPVKERADMRLICSPSGDYVAYTSQGQAHVMAWDGQQDRTIGNRGDYGPPGTFAGHGKLLYIAKRKDARQMDVIDVGSGKVLRTIDFELPSTDAIMAISIHRDGKRVLLSAGHVPYNLWKAEGYAYPATGWMSLFRHWDVPKRQR